MYKYVDKLFPAVFTLEWKLIYKSKKDSLFKPLDNLCHLIVEDNFSFPLGKEHLLKTSLIFNKLSSFRIANRAEDFVSMGLPVHDLRICNKLASSLPKKDAELITSGKHDEIRSFLEKKPKYIPLNKFLEDFFNAIMWDHNYARVNGEKFDKNKNVTKGEI